MKYKVNNQLRIRFAFSVLKTNLILLYFDGGRGHLTPTPSLPLNTTPILKLYFNSISNAITLQMNL